MNKIAANVAIESLNIFRQNLYDTFPWCADAGMDLLDSLSANQTARSVAELSLNEPFKRAYSSVYDAIEHTLTATEVPVECTTADAQQQTQKARVAIISAHLPAPVQRPFWLMGVDTTPNPRPFAATLTDRSIVYPPNPAPGNKPIAVGHSCSTLALLPERSPLDPPWIVPIDCQRVTSEQKATEVAAKQVSALLTDEALPFGRELSVEVADSSYCHVGYLAVTGGFANHVVIVRSANNRVFYDQPAAPTVSAHGHPLWYGQPFKLGHPTTWGPPDAHGVYTDQTKNGRALRIELQRWNGLLMRGTRACPMQHSPFDLVCCQVFDASTGQPLFVHPLWLAVMGARRAELSLEQIYAAYRQRFDIEHFFRFAKQHLLLDAFQTPVVEREENWWLFVCLAYIQLWMAAPLAMMFPNPWERYLPSFGIKTILTPSQVQRDFARIIRLLGTPARAPKRRGISHGRALGMRPPRRQRHPIIFKGNKHLLAA